MTASGSGSSSSWLWSRGGFAALFATISGYDEVKCFGEGSCYVNNIDDCVEVKCHADFACYNAKISNVVLMTCSGHQSCYEADISTVTGSIFECDGHEACRQATIDNAAQLDIHGNNSLVNGNVSNVDVVNVYGYRALEGAIIDNDGLTELTVNLYGYYSGSGGTITCKHDSGVDICNINCISNTGCSGLSLNCYGDCVISCDESNGIACPNGYVGPTPSPTIDPTPMPTDKPTPNPTSNPTDKPTANPSAIPSSIPTSSPTGDPTDDPTQAPSRLPTSGPTDRPTPIPTHLPTSYPTDDPTRAPTVQPTDQPAEAEMSSSSTTSESGDSGGDTSTTNGCEGVGNGSGSGSGSSAAVATVGDCITDNTNMLIIIVCLVGYGIIVTCAAVVLTTKLQTSNSMNKRFERMAQSVAASSEHYAEDLDPNRRYGGGKKSKSNDIQLAMTATGGIGTTGSIAAIGGGVGNRRSGGTSIGDLNEKDIELAMEIARKMKNEAGTGDGNYNYNNDGGEMRMSLALGMDGIPSELPAAPGRVSDRPTTRGVDDDEEEEDNSDHGNDDGQREGVDKENQLGGTYFGNEAGSPRGAILSQAPQPVQQPSVDDSLLYKPNSSGGFHITPVTPSHGDDNDQDLDI